MEKRLGQFPFVVVLAAGRSSRMLSEKPKFFHVLGGRPMVHYVLDTLGVFDPQYCVWVIQKEKESLFQESFQSYFQSLVSPDKSGGDGQDSSIKALAGCQASLRWSYQECPLGTGDALKAGFITLKEAQESLEETFSTKDVLVMMGDCPLVTPEILELLLKKRDHNPQADMIVMGMVPVGNHRYGRLVWTDRQSRVMKEQESPVERVLGFVDGNRSVKGIVECRDWEEEQKDLHNPSTPLPEASGHGEISKIKDLRVQDQPLKEGDICYGGIALIRAGALEDFLDKILPNPHTQEYQLTDLVGLIEESGGFVDWVMAPYQSLVGVNTRKDLADAERLMQDRFRRDIMEQGVTLVDPSSVFLSYDTQIGCDTTIYPFVSFGPGVVLGKKCEVLSFSHLTQSHIGNSCKIGPYARLREGVCMAAESEIGNFVELKDAQMGFATKIKHLSYVGNGRLGNHVTLGAGVITCNYDGRQKSYTTLGDGVFVGSNAVLIAPITLGQGSLVGAGSTLTQSVEQDALTLARSPQIMLSGGAKRYWARRKSVHKA
jgi:bifunctional UDP-N-acetylglucosamine pyrophosphorylase / glucosamine-1-phosphate N-acetyltransferase